MKHFKLFGINLKLFDGGAAGAGAGTGTGTTGGTTGTTGDTGATQQAEVKKAGSSRQRSGELSNVVYGKQPETTVDTAPAAEEKKETEVTTTSNTLEDKAKAFEDLINGEYKDQFTKRTQDIIDRRFKATKTLESKLEAQSPIIDLLMNKYKVADGDISKLAQAIEQDDAYWEEAAEEAGLTVEQYKAVQKLQHENEQFRRREQSQMEQRQAEARLNDWIQQGEALKQVYPDFDFRTEVQNRDFLGMLKAGVPVQKAYEVMHIDSMVTGAARVAAKQSEQQTVQRIKDRASRPAENGTSSNSASIIKSDVSSLTKADRAEIARRVARGEKISF